MLSVLRYGVLCSAASFILVLADATPVSQNDTAKPTPEESNFLFLAAEEPEHSSADQDVVTQGAPLSDTDDEEVIVKPVRGQAVVPQAAVLKNKSATNNKNAPALSMSTYSEVEKVQDKISKELPSGVFSIKKDHGELTIGGKFSTETAYSKNVSFLNSCNESDRYFFIKHVFDLNLEAKCINPTYADIVQLKVALRNKGTWGNPGSIAPTTESSVTVGSASVGSHKHSLGRHVVWIREAWLKTLLNAVFHAGPERLKHYFIFGLYPFQVGHGIALGSAYAIPRGALLGFYSDGVVDQYAPGFVFSGELIKDRLSYDVYAAILENKSDNPGATYEQIYAQEIGNPTPERRYGHVNWLLAARLQTVFYDDPTWGKMEMEPYILYNPAPEQKIEFVADARSKFATVGAQFDYKRGEFESSFEYAHNLGRQKVLGWDNNHLEIATDATTGDLQTVNSHVLWGTVKAPATTAIQAIISAAGKSATSNSAQIGTATIGAVTNNVTNTADRFSAPFTTKLRGWMVYGDAGYWLFNRQLQIAAMAGAASGDENPNFSLTNPKAELSDHSYNGFIGLQEVFSGGRVESMYVLGARSIARPLSLPEEGVQRGFYASTVSEFTNIVFTGVGLHVKPKTAHQIYWRPNAIAFWQHTATRAFDEVAKKSKDTCARNFLGWELNSFFNFLPLECLGLSFGFSVFFPGGHYKDIKGVPFDARQLALLRNATDTTTLPLLSTDKAFAIGGGIEYRF